MDSEPGYLRIATEEAFAPPELIALWRSMLEDGTCDDPGFLSLPGFYLRNTAERPAAILARLQDLGEVLVPVLAPLSWKHPDDAVRLGRASAWEEDEKYGAVPFGQKLLMRGEEEVPFLELRNLTFHHARETAESATT